MGKLKFESKYIDIKISKRMLRVGVDYYIKGTVKKIKTDEISGKKDILVQGKRNNNLYHVQIIKEKENYTIICDCPTAEADQPCKHAIAGVLALSDLEKYGKWQNYRFHPFFLLINLFRKFTN